MKHALLIAGICISVLFSVASRPVEYARSASPDGKHVAVAKYRAYQSWLSIMPGQSGDKSGWITVSKIDWSRIGEVDVEMVSMIQDIHWTSDTVELRLVASWKL